MQSIFSVGAKLVGIFWTAYALAMLLATGMALLAVHSEPQRLGSEMIFRFMTCIVLLTQLALAVSLMLATDRWAAFLRVPHDLPQFSVGPADALHVGTKLIGISSLVSAVPDLLYQCLVIVHPETVPVGIGPDLMPLVHPGAMTLLGYLCAMHTSSIVGLVTRTRPSDQTD